MPDRASWLILLGFLAALTLLVWLMARLIRSQGGLRPTCRRIVWEVRMTRRAFAEPFRVFSRHRRWARILSGYLADPAAPGTALAALDHADSTTDDGCYALAVQLSPARDQVRVVVAGRDPLPPAGPWQKATAEPGEWSWSAPAASVDPSDGPERMLLAVGVDRRQPGAVLVDWMRGPAALAVEGDPHASRGVLHALAAQIDHLPDGPPVQVARGVHPRHPGPDLDTLLDAQPDPLSGPLPDGVCAEPSLTPVVVCWSPTPEQAARISELCAAGRLRALVGGRVPGASWTFHAEPGGRLLAPGLHLDLESAALPRAIARTIRRDRRQPPAGTAVLRPGPAARATVPADAVPGPRTEAAPPRDARADGQRDAVIPAQPAYTDPDFTADYAADFDADFAEPAPAPALAPEPAPAPAPAPASESAPAPSPLFSVTPSGGGAAEEKPGKAETAAPPEHAETDPASLEDSGDDGDLAEPAPAVPPSRSGGISAASGTTNERTSSQP
ncbi:hypothetical protein B7755_003665 [Streptomyces sp. NBS 14/10]|uniref:hypothetical protein n=1 Tax=Streptomyces sp. NBS 14/10 TaxID=1945643 RepID=UPI00211B022A|nr:hypothetical protein [Streptomyces sp. NBS 14/10]KAK1177333.1 hypothetical protein B7755_003665 [Streptomyces sp. NBS 14/10]